MDEDSVTSPLTAPTAHSSSYSPENVTEGLSSVDSIASHVTDPRTQDEPVVEEDSEIEEEVSTVHTAHTCGTACMCHKIDCLLVIEERYYAGPGQEFHEVKCQDCVKRFTNDLTKSEDGSYSIPSNKNPLHGCKRWNTTTENPDGCNFCLCNSCFIGRMEKDAEEKRRKRGSSAGQRLSSRPRKIRNID
jgi:hypothetical protein